MTSPATLTILQAGLYTLVVGKGRLRSRSLGVPVGGAADRLSLALGNALVGNPGDAAALEVSLAGPTLVCDQPLGLVLFGAPFLAYIGDRLIPPGTTFTLEPGEVLRIGGTPLGMRAYLCVRGGFAVLDILGSPTGLAPLVAGSTLACTSSRLSGRSIQPLECPPRLRVLPGGQASWFPEGILAERVLRVGPASNRMGLRLVGEPLPTTGQEMVSEPVCPGTIQVTRDGQCIILGVDGQTIGGYPKVAQVIGADLDRLGQFRPGTEVSFEYVSLAQAEQLAGKRRRLLAHWQMRLGTTAGSSS